MIHIMCLFIIVLRYGYLGQWDEYKYNFNHTFSHGGRDSSSTQLNAYVCSHILSHPVLGVYDCDAIDQIELNSPLANVTLRFREWYYGRPSEVLEYLATVDQK